MKLLQSPSLDPEDVITTPAGRSTLNREEMAWIDQYYLNNQLRYKSLIEEYEKERCRNNRHRITQTFPSKQQWVPLSQSLLPLDRKLLDGPAPDITLLKKVQLRNPNTSRLITYSSDTWSFEDTTCSIKKRVLSAFVCINHKQQHEVPEFGQIKWLFLHQFGEQSTLFAEAEVFGSAEFNNELKMWFIQLKSVVKYSRLFPLKGFFEALVVAIDKNNALLWFLNYQWS